MLSLPREISKCKAENTQLGSLSVRAHRDGDASLLSAIPRWGAVGRETGDTVAPRAWDDRSPGVLGHDRCWTEITKQNRKHAEQQLGQTHPTSHLLLIYTFISYTRSQPM